MGWGPGGQDGRVLVVDHDRETVTTVSGALETLGYGVRGAGSFEEAIAAAREETPALVIVDVELPGRSGYELLQATASGGRSSTASPEGVRRSRAVSSIVSSDATASPERTAGPPTRNGGSAGTGGAGARSGRSPRTGSRR